MKSSLVSVQGGSLPIIQLQALLIVSDGSRFTPDAGAISSRDNAPPFWTWFVENPRPAGRTIELAIERDQISVASR